MYKYNNVRLAFVTKCPAVSLPTCLTAQMVNKKQSYKKTSLDTLSHELAPLHLGFSLTNPTPIPRAPLSDRCTSSPHIHTQAKIYTAKCTQVVAQKFGFSTPPPPSPHTQRGVSLQFDSKLRQMPVFVFISQRHHPHS